MSQSIKRAINQYTLARKFGEGGTMSTGTPGANNPTYDEEKERSVTNKNNTRYGIRKASKEDIERLTK